LTGKQLLLLILLLSILAVPSLTEASPGLGISVESNRPWYYIGESINVYGSVLADDAPLVSANVALEIHDHAGSPVITRSIQTNSSGIFSLDFSLPTESLTGNYVAYVSCTYDGQTALNNTSFQVKPPSALVVTIAAEKELYNVGDNITIGGSVMLNSTKQPHILVALEVQNPQATPIIVRVLETDSQGDYGLTFPASSDSLVGNYNAFASASYNGSIARAETSFELKPNISSVDINQDGKVNILDLAIVARAWGSYPGHPRWDPRCDVNGDGKINIMDITLVAKEYQP
jgi:uncharacterized protein YfaS (alpha-2-macroglobulin family)